MPQSSVQFNAYVQILHEYTAMHLLFICKLAFTLCASDFLLDFLTVMRDYS